MNISSLTETEQEGNPFQRIRWVSLTASQLSQLVETILNRDCPSLKKSVKIDTSFSRFFFLTDFFSASERLRQISQAPITDDPEDVDYIDLLLEYKEIQKQLDNIKKEEEKTALFLADINSGD